MRVGTPSILTQLDTVKLEMDISLEDPSRDDWLNRQIAVMSDLVEQYCDRTFEGAQRTHEYVYDTMDWRFEQAKWVGIPLYPAVAIASVGWSNLDAESGSLTEGEHYIVRDLESGMIELTHAGLWELIDNIPTTNFSTAITLTVDHTGGYSLPGAASNPLGLAELPAVIEDTVIQLVKQAYYSRKNDFMVRSERAPDVLETSYFSPGNLDESRKMLLSRVDAYSDARF